MRSRSRYRDLIAVAVVSLAYSTLAFAQCQRCEEYFAQWVQELPFEAARERYNPYTLGLPAGAMAPDIPGVTLAGNRTILVMLNGQHDIEEMVVLRELSEIDALQVVAVLSGHTPERTANYETLLGAGVHIVQDPDAAIVCAEYYVGAFYPVGRIVFLVDEAQTIVLRRLGKPGWLGYEDDRVVRQFAQSGLPPEDTIPQAVLWYDAVAPWPTAPLETATGEPYVLALGPVRLFYWWGPSVYTDVGRLICDALNRLLQEFPSVEFLRVTYCVTASTMEQLWWLAQRTEIVDLHPSEYGLPLNVFLELMESSQEEGLAVVRGEDDDYPGWRNLLDPDGGLGILYGIYLGPSVMILAGDGTVLLPLTPYSHATVEGETRIHPGVEEELRTILSSAVESN
jgi:hypothetical protein